MIVSDTILNIGLEERGIEISTLREKSQKKPNKLEGIEIPIEYNKL